MARKLTLDFLHTEAASGGALALAAVAAMALANSPLAPDYFALLKSMQAVQIGPLRLELSVADWIKEGLMSVFFLVVGLEIKHEVLRGELSDPRKLATPILAAAGGMVGPILVYLIAASTLGAPTGGWPIPVATDIAFALAIFGVFGRGLPNSLRVFLLTLAIVDDLGAILLIGVLFSQDADLGSLALAIGVLAAVGWMARRWRLTAPLWALAFAVVWMLTVSSGLSTSLAAVAFAAIVPIRPRSDDRQSPLSEAMKDLHPYNAFLVLPLFAIAKAGVPLVGLPLAQLGTPLAVGIALGLLVGKQAGVFAAAWLGSRMGIGVKPSGATWAEVYGVALLCGVGFTMSLFIGSLAFPGPIDSPEQTQVKIGVLAGSVLSGLAGGLVLWACRSSAARGSMRVPERAARALP